MRRATRRMNERPSAWINLGVVGSMLALSVCFVHVPAAVWAGNATEFHFSIATVIGIGLAIVGAGTAAFAAILRRMPARAQAVCAALAAALGIILWMYGLVLVGSLQALDGSGPLKFGAGLGTWELLVVAIVGLALAAAARRSPRAATSFLAVLNIGLVVISATSVFSAQRGNWTSSARDAAALFSLSRKTNVVVVLLDGLQADIAAGVLEQHPALKAAFDGFCFYPDTLAAAPTTFLGLPAIHSGEVYNGETTPAEYFTQSIASRSFVTRFANAGYAAALVNPLDGICPAGTASCTTAPQVLGTAARQRWRDVLRLADVTLFRVVPFRAKAWVWDRGRWRLSRQRGLGPDVLRIVDDIHAMERIAERLYVDPSARPSLKVIHSLTTHNPYVMGEDCQTLGDGALAKAPTQARCALEATAHLLDALRRISVYDRTAVLVLADHGLNANSYPDSPTNGADAWKRLAGSANPLFLFKPLDSCGPLQTSPVTVSVADVGATLCAATAACLAPAGIPAGQSDTNHLRRFDQYVWHHAFWQTRAVPGITFYEVRGPLSRPESWHVRAATTPSSMLGADDGRREP